ncbi:S1/P1 nuclease [Mesorhizobium sp. 2RAF21]|uniref:S1/P1 nuclease n=1 Tax=Mesorhizobium sp. 2RAF21 TaxID=3232995 RepID=UPI003F9A10C1
MRTLMLTALGVLAATPIAYAWGTSGHSIVAEIAQHRLNEAATVGVASILGAGTSLASIGSWADDERARDRKTTRWHFVEIPSAATAYDATRDCISDPTLGDCIIAAIDRELALVSCATAPTEQRQRALKFLVHLIGDLHQPLHAIKDERGGNGIDVTITTQEGVNGDLPFNTNLHSAWDATLIDKTAWSWGSYVERLETGWLRTADVAAISAGTTADWANESHRIAVKLIASVPSNIVLDDAYRNENLPLIDQQLGTAGLRLAELLNKAFSTSSCLP